MRFALILATGLGLSVTQAVTPAMAQTKAPLSSVTGVTDGIMSLGIANTVRRKCPDISGRMIKAFFYVDKLKAHAKSLGYSSAEVDAFLDDKAAEEKLKARGIAYLKSKGVVENQPETLCAFGHAEIAKSSLIGSFLRTN